MSFPVTFQLGPLVLPAHLTFELLAFFLGFQVYLRLKKGTEDPIAAEDRQWIVIGAALGAALGSKLLGFLEHPSLWSKVAEQPVLLLASKTIVGGLLGGLLGVEWTKKRLGVTTSSGDLFVYPLVVGMAIGRVGCFLTGTQDGTHGLPTSSPFGMDLGDGISRHPTALYEIAFLLFLGLALRSWQRRSKLVNGALFRSFMAGYLTWRLAIEWLKPVERVYLGLSAIQVACALGLLYYLSLSSRLREVTPE